MFNFSVDVCFKAFENKSNKTLNPFLQLCYVEYDNYLPDNLWHVQVKTKCHFIKCQITLFGCISTSHRVTCHISKSKLPVFVFTDIF